MTLKKLFAAAAVLILALGTVSQASPDQQDYYYINPQTISPTSLPEPALNGSDELNREADQIIKIQQAISESEIAKAKDEEKFRPELVTGDLTNYPETAKLTQRAAKDCELVVRQAKDYWQITRPYLADKKIKALVKAPGGKSFAYPSGHTACSLVTAEVFGQVMPDKLAASEARAGEIAEHRVMIGAHWPQDITAGHQLGMLIFKALQTSDKYQHDLSKARLELQ